MRRAHRRVGLAILGTLAAGSIPFVASVTGWPEIVTPAWFVTRGFRLYDQIFFPHTPLLIVSTALAGELFGIGAPVFKLVAGAAMAAAGALLVLGTRHSRSTWSGAAAGLVLGGPLFILWTAYTEGPALWPEPFLAPFLLGATLLLERFETTGSPRWLVGGAGILGVAILVKQTSAWAGVAALLWLVLRSARSRWPLVLGFIASLAAPYALFAVLWALLYRTWAHVRWTLIVPIFSGLGREIATPPTLSDLHESLAPFLALPALGLLVSALPAAARRRTPAIWIALGSAGMAWPRFGLLHLAAGTGIVALLSARAALVIWTLARGRRRRSWSLFRLLAFAAGAACLAISVSVAVLGGGPLLADRVGAPVQYWNDETSSSFVGEVLKRVPPGQELFVFEVPHQTLYPLTRTLSPGGLYVNPGLWYCLNKENVEARLIDALARRKGLPVLFREPPAEDRPLVRTRLYRFLKEQTDVVQQLDGKTSWRVVR